MNHELYDDVDAVQRIKMQQLCWMEHVARMDENAPARKIFYDKVEKGVLVGPVLDGRIRY